MIQADSESQTSCLVPCNLCGSTDEEELSLVDRDGAYLRTVICRRCGLVYSNPRPGAGEVRDYYEHSYRLDYKGTYEPKPKHLYRSGKLAVQRYRGLAEHLKPGSRGLDFGAGSGEFVYMLRSAGHEASGFEPNEGYADFASNTLGLPVTHGFYQDARIEPGSLDAVTSFHVFEHLESPFDAMRKVQEWLRPGGLLLLEVPNVEAVCQWPRNRFHRAHLFNFSPATLENMGRKAGLSVILRSISPDGGNLAVLFRKEDSTTPVSGEIPGNYDRVSSIVRGHTPMRHLFSRYPFIRPLQKIATGMEERRVVRCGKSPTAILKDVIANGLNMGNGRPASAKA